MQNSNKKDNILIKRNKLVLMMKKAGIKRINKECFNLIEKDITAYLIKFTETLKEETLINGRETLKKEDVEKVINRLQKKENNWEI